MKKLTEKEIKEKIIKYLGKKGITAIINDDNELVWNYTPYYSKYRVELSIGRKDPWKENSEYVVKYHTSIYICGLNRRKTSVNDGFCLKIYRNLLWIKRHLDEDALEHKEKIDTKNKYCTELEMYYKKIHKSVSVASNKNSDNSVNIFVSCYDENMSTYYLVKIKL
jgi:hypothetical protein